MASPITYPIDDRDLLDDAALWAVIDSAAAASLSSSNKFLKRRNQFNSPPSISGSKNPRYHTPPLNPNKLRSLMDGEVVQQPPLKIARSCVSETSSSPMAMVKHVARRETPSTTPSSCIKFSPRVDSEVSPSTLSYGGYGGGGDDERGNSDMRHSLSGQFPSVSLFKEYQSAAMAILEKSDYTLISGSPYIKKTGWRKISCYFNISYEIKDKTIEFDENRNVQRAEFVVRAYMHGGRFSDGWGSCDRREKRFMKPNNDIPSTAETRAKNKACQCICKPPWLGMRDQWWNGSLGNYILLKHDLLGIGEYRPGTSHASK